MPAAADIFSICEFHTPPESAVRDIKTYLSHGMPVNVRIGHVREPKEALKDPEAGLLHVICSKVDPQNEAQTALAEKLIEIVFQFGGSWILLDGSQKTPGEICQDRGMRQFYEIFVRAGVRSELVLQRITEDEVDSGSDDAAGGQTENDHAEATATESIEQVSRKRRKLGQELPESNQKDYLVNDLQYTTQGSLLTDQSDAVMMDWEAPIMKRSAELVTKSGGTVLNIGFGMGIIDGYIQELGPGKHYISEAHPDVLDRMRRDGWYNKDNVVVLEGRWQDTLPKLLEMGVTFDGIYFDTFSEHYKDMLLLFDRVVGLLEFDGVFSFFNGLGADRQITYDVYKQVVEFDLQEFGLKVEFEPMHVEVPQQSWDPVKRPYFVLSEYALPKVEFNA